MPLLCAPSTRLREQVQTSLKMDFIEDDMEENGWRGGIDVDMERIQEETTEIEVTDASAVYRYPTDGGENVQFILFDLGETEKFTAAQFTAKELDETLNTDPEDSLEEDETADSEQQLDAVSLKRMRMRRFCIGLGLLIVIAVVFIAIWATKWRENDNQLSGKDNTQVGVVEDEVTPMPTTEIFGFIFGLLIPFTAENVLLDPSTPQGQAFQHLLSEAEEAEVLPVPFRVTQRYALMTLFYSTDGENWDNRIGWNGFADNECSWNGIDTCRRLEEGSLAATNLDFSSNSLAGPLPTEICILKDNVEKIDMSDNALTGDIPSCLAEFEKLQSLRLDGNDFEGSVNPEICLMKWDAEGTLVDFTVNCDEVLCECCSNC